MIFFNEPFNAKFRRHFSCSTFPITPKSQICPKMMKFWIIKILWSFFYEFSWKKKHRKNMKFLITFMHIHASLTYVDSGSEIWTWKMDTTVLNFGLLMLAFVFCILLGFIHKTTQGKIETIAQRNYNQKW